MKLSLRWFWAASTALIFSSLVSAELKWDSVSQQKDAPPGTTAVVIPFVYTNNGTQPLTITDVRTSCACTTATITKRVLAPGEQGQVNAVFKVGALRGQHTKQVFIYTSEAPRKPISLTLKVNILAVVSLSKSTLDWIEGEATTPKSLTVDIQPGTEVTLEPLAAEQGEHLDAKLTLAADGKSYALTLKPKDTSRHYFTTLRLLVTHTNVIQPPLLVFVKINP